MRDFDTEDQVTNLLRYHLLQREVPLGDLETGVPYFAPTLLTNTSYTNTTGGQRVILNKRNDGTIVFTSGADKLSTVLLGDIPFSGGLLHIVDTLLVPPYNLVDTCRTWFPELQAFLGALYRFGLVDDLSTTPDLTLFVPTGSAFQRTAGTLSMRTDEELRNILAYHVVPGRLVYSTALVDGSSWPTLANKRITLDEQDQPGVQEDALNLSVTVAGNDRYIDSSRIVNPDILLANGVLHMYVIITHLSLEKPCVHTHIHTHLSH